VVHLESVPSHIPHWWQGSHTSRLARCARRKGARNTVRALTRIGSTSDRKLGRDMTARNKKYRRFYERPPRRAKRCRKN